MIKGYNTIPMNNQIIIDTFIKDGKIIPARTNEAYIKKHGFYEYLTTYYNDSESIKETIYRIYNNINKRPVCKHCGKHVNFNNNGFATFCSKKCSNQDPDVLEKNKINVSKSLKYAYIERGSQIKEKRSNTLKEHYGQNVSSPFCIKEIQDKAKNTILEKYGVENIQMKSEYRRTREDMQNASIQYQKHIGYDIEYINESNKLQVIVKHCCNIHGDVTMDWTIFNNRTKPYRKLYTTLCTICNPVKSQETTIETQIKIILDKHKIKYIQHERSIIKPYELDFFLPDFNIAIECNGSYWHSGREQYNKHIKKLELCEIKNITLLYYWSYQIYNEIDMIENDILIRTGLCKDIHTNITYDNGNVICNYMLSDIDIEKIQIGTKLLIPNERTFIPRNCEYVDNINSSKYYVNYREEKIISLSDIKLETDDDDLVETLLNKQGISQCWNLGYKIYRKI